MRKVDKSWRQISVLISDGFIISFLFAYIKKEQIDYTHLSLHLRSLGSILQLSMDDFSRLILTFFSNQMQLLDDSVNRNRLIDSMYEGNRVTSEAAVRNNEKLARYLVDFRGPSYRLCVKGNPCIHTRVLRGPGLCL